MRVLPDALKTPIPREFSRYQLASQVADVGTLITLGKQTTSRDGVEVKIPYQRVLNRVEVYHWSLYGRRIFVIHASGYGCA